MNYFCFTQFDFWQIHENNMVIFDIPLVLIMGLQSSILFLLCLFMHTNVSDLSKSTQKID